MGDEEEPQCKVEYLDLAEGAEPEETNWIRRAGRCKVTYPNGHIFEGLWITENAFPFVTYCSSLLFHMVLGTFDAERIKQGQGVYIWMAPGSEEDETPVEKARYEGEYKNGLKHGVGKMVFPNGNIYEGEWFENMVSLLCFSFGAANRRFLRLNSFHGNLDAR